MSEPNWIGKAVVLAIHDAQIAEHGGGPGLRDEGLLESALARPRNLFADGNPDVYRLAAAYAFGIAANRPFTDGNKRTVLVVSTTFPSLAGKTLAASPEERVATFLRRAAGEIDEDALADWFRQGSTLP